MVLGFGVGTYRDFIDFVSNHGNEGGNAIREVQSNKSDVISKKETF